MNFKIALLKKIPFLNVAGKKVLKLTLCILYPSPAEYLLSHKTRSDAEPRNSSILRSLISKKNKQKQNKF